MKISDLTVNFIKKLSYFKNNTKYRITFLLLIPVVALSTGLYYITFMNLQHNKETLQSNYLYALQSAAQDSESKIENVVYFVESYSKDPDIVDMLQQTQPDPQECIAFVHDVNNSLLSKYNFVDSVVVYNQYNGFCVTSNEIIDSTTFFSDFYPYQDYDANYWKHYNYYYSSLYEYRSLPPTLTSLNGQEKFIQPLIFLKFNDSVIKNIIIINISFTSMMEQARSMYNLDENTFVLNNHSAKAFNTLNSEILDIYNTTLYNNLLQNNTSFDYVSEAGRYFVISHPKSNNLSSYTYFSMIPYAKLQKAQRRGVTKTAIILVLVMILTIFITFKVSRLLLLPFENIADKLSPATKGTDLIASINSSIDNINSKNSNFETLLPYMQEKYLIDFLNSKEYTLGNEAKDYLKSTLPFECKYFASIIVQLYSLPQFYEEYTLKEITNIQTGFYNIVKETFGSVFRSCTLTTEKDILYIIINTDNYENTSQQISSVLSKLNDLLRSDWNQIVLMSGVGSVYEGYDGLKHSHKEALEALNPMPKEQPKVIINSSHHRNDVGLLTRKEEENFTNFLITYNYESAWELLNEITKKNQHASITEQKNLYSQIIHIISKIMRSKNISNAIDYKTISEILERPIDDIKNETLILLSNFKTSYSSKNPTAANITAYLQNEYKNPNLSLDNIADVFSISKTYASSLLKKHLGITFRDYLTSIRIEVAKKLLSTTNMPISEIMIETGFTNKQTFSRVFKANTGMTALEYRKKNI